MTSKGRKAMMILGGAALVAVALVLRGMVPEIMRYVRIRRM